VIDIRQQIAFLRSSMKKLLSLLAAVAALSLSACVGSSTGYSIKAYAPKNPNAVRIKVSTSTGNVYVTEGDRVLLAAHGCVGMPGNSTPGGNFTVGTKIKNKRSGSYGFYVNGSQITSAKAGAGSGRYIGYPMMYWVGFAQAPAYGFHQGFVHPAPRTHGCIRLHREAAARLFALVRVGTPINVSHTQPEDSTAGRSVRRLNQANDPDPAASLLISESWFREPAGPLLL
jgi:hypothetical protein